MKYTMKNISLFTCSVIASIVVLSACAQTTVSVRATNVSDEKPPVKSAAAAQRQYEPISRNEPYVVRAGDTLYGISFRAGLTYREVAAWNNIPEPYTVKVGQRLILQPANDTRDSNSVAVVTPVAASVTKPAETHPVEVPAVVTKPAVEVPAPVVAMTTKPVVPTTPVVIGTEKPVPVAENQPAENHAGTISWRWPSDGTVIARYVQGDPTQQGINIGGKSGQPVKASGDGTVVYSGAGLVGYGELIIIKHNNEWLSAYAHNRRRLVAEGSKVRAGDVIAEMGRTGTMRDMLHFEIRRNGKPVDPLLYLPKQ